MLFEGERQVRCCAFTGHRPGKLQQPEEVVKEKLEKEIRGAITDGFTVFISGMARGVDLWAAEIVLRLRETGQPIKMVCASPYPGFEHRWTEVWQQRYRAILSRADLVRFICPCYSRYCFQMRNEWMVNHCARVIAVFNGEKGGTKNTLKYAREMGIPVIIIEDKSASHFNDHR